MSELQQEIDAGYVRVQTHPTLPYKIYGYTEKAQFDRHWNNVTLHCRGLILDGERIVARPFKKFFNLGEGYAEFDWNAPVEVTDKIDGSLGIIYSTELNPYGCTHAVATRGSFSSLQAIHATQVLQDKYMGVIFPNAWTVLVEIVYPQNRIVLNYGDMDDLVLLGAVDKEYGFYLGPKEVAAILDWPGPVTQVFEYKTLQEAFSADPRPNAEGYVVRSGNKMVKIKQVDYLSLHKIITGLNDRVVWEQLANGKSVDDICLPLPDEFHDYVRNLCFDLSKQFDKMYELCYNEYINVLNRVGFEATRKNFAIEASKSKFKKYLFKLFDGKQISDDIWQDIRPAAIINGLQSRE